MIQLTKDDFMLDELAHWGPDLANEFFTES